MQAALSVKDSSMSYETRAKVIHDAVPGRVRFRHRGLIGREDLALSVTEALRRCGGVESVGASAITGSVLVKFDVAVTAVSISHVIDATVSGLDLPGGLRRRSLSAAAAPQDAAAVQDWHAMTSQDVAEQLGAPIDGGLSPEEAARRLALWGPNDLPHTEPRSAAAIFAEQLFSLPVFLLGASAALSLATGGVIDAVVIGAVVALNASIATATERGAERTIRGLSDYTPQPVPVLREGARTHVHPRDLARGDLLLLERGTLVPADARIVASVDLSVNESALTGEALPVQKEAQWVLPAETVLPERRNMVFRGTSVTGGGGAALVTATGGATEIGQVQRLLGSVRAPETPIQRQLNRVERELIFLNALICAAVFGIGLYHRHGLVPMLRTAISLVVAAIPEGLPAVATTTLALGVQTMRERDVLVRKLDAVETLGAVEVIGLDKTGTLTENRMAAVALHANGRALDLDGARILNGKKEVDETTASLVRRLLEVTALCSEATVRPSTRGFDVDGTPTEAALIEAARAVGIDVAALRLDEPMLSSMLRSETRKRMSTLHGRDGRRLLCVKGDPLDVLSLCSAQRLGDDVRPLDDPARSGIVRANERMAGRALRVLGVAVSEGCEDLREERNLVWLGLVGLINPIRPSVIPALKQLRQAGIRAVMITGDQSATALAIAKKLDLGENGEVRVLEAGQIAAPDTLPAVAGRAQVFARVSPVEKLKIVQALQNGGRVVGMTGDGINDGPALRAANISIAMGGEGTDVAREVADMVLASDDLDGIVEAVRLGRATYANIRKVLRYLISTSVSETFAMLGAALLDGGVAMTSTQLLWLNIAGEPLPAMALGLEEPESDVLDQPPHDPRAPILTGRDFRQMLVEGAVIGASTLAGYYLAGGARNPTMASTITFHGMTLGQLLHSINCRSEGAGFPRKLVSSPNTKLNAALAISCAAQAMAQFWPASRRALNLSPVGWPEFVRIAMIALGATAVNDTIAYLRSRDRRHKELHQIGEDAAWPAT